MEEDFFYCFFDLFLSFFRYDLFKKIVKNVFVTVEC